MENEILYRFVDELRQQVRFAVLSFDQLRSNVHSVDAERVFLHVDGFLAHALAVAQFLWPRRDRSLERGAAMRKALAIGDESPLKLAGLREGLEAPDEAFEDWLTALPERNYVDMNVMPGSAIGSFRQDSFHRNLDSDSFKLRLRGIECDLRAVWDALRKLESAIEFWRKTHQPW